MRLRVLGLQRVGHAAGTDESENVHLAGGHQWSGDFAPLAIDGIDDTRRKRLLKGAQQQPVQQHAVTRRLEHGRITHDERGDESGESFIKWVIVRPHTEDDTERRAANLRHHVLLDNETRGHAIQFFHGVNRVADVIKGAVEFLAGVPQALANLPHQQRHHFLAHLLHAESELLHMTDALAHRAGGPVAAALIVGAHGGIKRGQRRVFRHQREAANRDWPTVVAHG
ncbi:MAG: hypothetical protein BWY76_03463 [bacterium ADurb.Bin429]|nr:MAG: hypothetical protein BWY76_03463 [bacterium ADurb.Bin429]